MVLRSSLSTNTINLDVILGSFILAFHRMGSCFAIQKMVSNMRVTYLFASKSLSLGEILERWPYKDIVSWGYSETKFIVVQGDVVQQKKLVFGTHKGKMMRGLIHAYMQYIVQAKLKEFEVNGDVVAKHPMTFK